VYDELVPSSTDQPLIWTFITTIFAGVLPALGSLEISQACLTCYSVCQRETPCKALLSKTIASKSCQQVGVLQAVDDWLGHSLTDFRTMWNPAGSTSAGTEKEEFRCGTQRASMKSNVLIAKTELGKVCVLLRVMC
jgi:hypothetical protein